MAIARRMTIKGVPYFCQAGLKREGTCSTTLGVVAGDGVVAGTGEVAILFSYSSTVLFGRSTVADGLLNASVHEFLHFDDRWCLSQLPESTGLKLRRSVSPCARIGM